MAVQGVDDDIDWQLIKELVTTIKMYVLLEK